MNNRQSVLFRNSTQATRDAITSLIFETVTKARAHGPSGNSDGEASQSSVLRAVRDEGFKVGGHSGDWFDLVEALGFVLTQKPGTYHYYISASEAQKANPPAAYVPRQYPNPFRAPSIDSNRIVGAVFGILEAARIESAAQEVENAKRQAEQEARNKTLAASYLTEEFRQEVIEEIMFEGASRENAENRTRDQAKLFAEAARLKMM